MMGSDSYETLEEIENKKVDILMGIGENCFINNAIIKGLRYYNIRLSTKEIKDQQSARLDSRNEIKYSFLSPENYLSLI